MDGLLQIKMPRGDLRTVGFCVNIGDSLYTDFDNIYFTVKESSAFSKFIFQKKLSDGSINLNQETGEFTFTINPEDTDQLSFKDYVFDIELYKEGIIKDTTMGKLTITEESTYAINE